MISAIAIDDEPLPLEVLELYCERTELVSLKNVFSDTREARKYLNQFPVDLLFLDIHMPALSGIDFYKGLSQNAMVIFTTAHSKYAVEGFNLNAVDFLLKPFSYERFEIAVNKAHDYYRFLMNKNDSPQRSLFVCSEYNLRQIPLDEIHYIESFGDYLDIHTVSGSKTTSRMTMKALMEKLPDTDFLRVHRSYIVSINKVEHLRNKHLVIGAAKIPIGGSYQEETRRRFSNY